MLNSPLGCAFLLLANAAGLPPDEIARPRNSIYLAAFAANQLQVWDAEYPKLQETARRLGQRHHDLALAILDSQIAVDWFGPPDREHQIFVQRDGNPAPDPVLFVPPASPLSNWERYAEKSKNGIYTSTLGDRSSAILVEYDERIGDFTLGNDRYSPHAAPYPCWLLKADPAARVYEIDGPPSWHDLCVRYPTAGVVDSNTPPFTLEPGRLTPDWGEVAADWDGVHLTSGGQLTTEQVRVESDAGWTYLWGWDIEQTLWLRWMFYEVEQLPDHTPPPYALEYLRHPMYLS